MASTDLDVGASVLVDVGAKEGSGTVRYVGPVATRLGTWIGIELDARSVRQGLGRNDGTAFGIRYFQCAEGAGLFLPPNRIRSASPLACETPTPARLAATTTTTTTAHATTAAPVGPHLAPSPRRSDIPRPPSRSKTPTRIATSPRSPALRTDRTVSRTDRPVPRTDRPVSRSERPVSRSERPVSRSERPVSRSERPASRSERPVSRSERPASRSDRTGTGFSAPAPSAASPVPPGRTSPLRRPRPSALIQPRAGTGADPLPLQARRPSTLPATEVRNTSKGKRSHTPHLAGQTASHTWGERTPLASLPPPPSPERVRALEQAAAERSISPTKHSRTQSAQASIPQATHPRPDVSPRDPSRAVPHLHAHLHPQEAKLSSLRPLPLDSGLSPPRQCQPSAASPPHPKVSGPSESEVSSPPPSLPPLPKFFQSPRTAGPSNWFGPRRSGAGSPSRPKTPSTAKSPSGDDVRTACSGESPPRAEGQSEEGAYTRTAAPLEADNLQAGRQQTLALAVVLKGYFDLASHSRRTLEGERSGHLARLEELEAQLTAKENKLADAVSMRERALETAYDARLRELEETYRARQRTLEEEWVQRELALVSEAANAATMAQEARDRDYGGLYTTGARQPSVMSARKEARNASSLSTASAASAALDAAAMESRVDALESRLATALAEAERLQEAVVISRDMADKAEQRAQQAEREVDALITRGTAEVQTERDRRTQLERVVRGLEGECERYRQQLEDVHLDAPVEGLGLDTELDEPKTDTLGAALERARKQMSDQAMDLCDDCGERGHGLENCPYAQAF